jgi:hypothetical protein
MHVLLMTVNPHGPQLVDPLSPSGWDHHSLQFPPMPLLAVIPSPPALPPEPPHYSRVTFDSFTLDSDLSLDFADSFQFFVPEMDEDDFLDALSHLPEEEDP